MFYTGIRTFSARPIFSQHRSGSKQKFERFFQPGDVTVASCIAPITFPPMPVLVFKCVGRGAGGGERPHVGAGGAACVTAAALQIDTCHHHRILQGD